MVRLNIKLILACAVILAALAGVAYHQREPLLTIGINHLLAQYRISVSAFQGLQVNGSRVELAELELAVHDLGLRLVITGVNLGYERPTFFSAPQLEILDVRSVNVLRTPSLLSGNPAPESEALLLSDML